MSQVFTPAVIRQWAKAIGFCLAFAGSCQAQLVDDSGRPHLRTWGYVAWWMPDGWRSIDLTAFDRLLFFELRATAQGRIESTNGWPTEWSALIAAAQFAQKPIDLTITVLDAASFRAVFSSEGSMRTLLSDIEVLARNEAVQGIHLDVEVYEEVDNALWNAYQTWVIKLADQLAALQPARQLSAFIPMGGKRSLYGAESLKRMHSVVVQGYDAHWQESRVAGPVAPLDGPYGVTWKAGMQQMDALGVPRAKQLFSFPLYGYEWSVEPSKGASKVLSKGVTTTFAVLEGDYRKAFPLSVEDRVSSYGAHFEAASASSYYRFRDKAGHWWEGWFEDWWSLQQKQRFLRREQLGGIAFFVLGYDRGQLVNASVASNLLPRP